MLCLASDVLHMYESYMIFALFGLDTPYALPLLVFVHLAWLVAWLPCLPCCIWCRFIIIIIIITSGPNKSPKLGSSLSEKCLAHWTTQKAAL
jgi:hypothetical protein